MNRFNINKFIVVFLTLLVGCEKDIEIEVDDAEIKPVIEAKISNHPGDAIVSLYYSQNLQDDIMPTSITDAQVFIKDITQNKTYTLTQGQPGIYRNFDLKGSIEHQYQLQVILADGRIYNSISTLPKLISLTSVHHELAEDALQDDDDDEKFYEITPQFVDEAGVENYYQILIYNKVSGEMDLNVIKDLGFDGLSNTQRIYTDGLPQDTLIISLHNLDKPAYEYLFGLYNNINQSSGTPTNPISNIDGDVLGYFKAYSYNHPISIVLE